VRQNALARDWQAWKRLAGPLQGSDKIFLALSFEFFLGRFKVRNSRCDFFPLQSDCIFFFVHFHSFESSCGDDDRDCGANWGEPLPDHNSPTEFTAIELRGG
jgi:hypothetical protein